MQTLGFRHVRDGLIDTPSPDFYNRHNELGRAGIKGIFISSPDQSDTLLLDYPRRMKDSFEAFEAPNEYDLSRDANWVATLSSFVSRLNATVKGSAATSRFQVIGPSLTSPDAFTRMRGVCAFDFDNLHNYFGGHNPGTLGWGSNGYGSMSWSLSNVAATCAAKPTITTETGYQTDPTMAQGIPEDVAAKYAVRLYLEQWRRGIKRTYTYELIDLPPGFLQGDSKFGLLRSDFSAKPSYSALTNLLPLLADPGASLTTDDFAYTLSSDLTELHHALSRNGMEASISLSGSSNHPTT